jgi:hypothetical protein
MRVGFFEVKDWDRAFLVARLTSDLEAFGAGQPGRLVA